MYQCPVMVVDLKKSFMYCKLLSLINFSDCKIPVHRLVLGLVLMVGSFSLSAQQFGGNPPTLRWRQLKTDSVNILYPTGADSTAFRVAALIQRLQRTSTYRLGDRLENIPVVLQTETTNSNGYVGLGPYRSEFYLSAPTDVMDLGSIDWASTLALHEYRHVLQYNNINRGVTRVVDVLLGDNARSLLSDMAVPNWFFEGDAVYSETLHSTEGRGRLPRFMNVYPMLRRDGRHYNYQKWRNGSYKDYIPGHYNLGYILVAYGYKNYGEDFWGKVIRDAARYKGLFYPFQKAIKTNSGVSFRSFRQAAFQAYLKDFDSLAWITSRSLDEREDTVYAVKGIAIPTTKEVVGYLYPYPSNLTNGTFANNNNLEPGLGQGVIALKQPSKSVSRFVYLNNKNGALVENDLGLAPITRDGYFGYNADYIVYTRYQTDPRWAYKEYSDLEVLNIKTGNRKRITHKGRYFTPDVTEVIKTGNSQKLNLSESELLIAASELNPDGRSAIAILNQNGNVLQKWAAPKGGLYNYPKFFRLGNKAFNNADTSLGLVFIMRASNGRMGLGYVEMGKDRSSSTPVKILLPYSNRLIASPVVTEGKLYFSSVYPGKSDPYTDIFQMDLSSVESKKTNMPAPVRIARAIRDVHQAYGLPNGHLVASLQTAGGYGLFSWREQDPKKQQAAGLTIKSDAQDNNNFNGYLPAGGWSTKSVDKAFKESKPVNANGKINERVFAGASSSFLDTTDLSAAKVDYQTTKQQQAHYATAVRKYPLLSHPFHFHSLQPTVEDPVYSLDLLGQNILNTAKTDLSYSYNRVTEISQAGADLTLGLWYVAPYIHVDYSWNHLAVDSKGNQYAYKELTSQLGLQLPLNFTGGRWSRSLYLSTALSQSNLYWSEPTPKPGAALTEIRYLYSRAQFSMYTRQAIRQLYPRLGLNSYTEMNTPLDGQGARQWMNSTTIYLPGLLQTHSLRLNLAYQNRDTAGSYGYNSRFPFSRGYSRPAFKTMWKFGWDYDLPLWYPDFGFAGMAYFFRVRGNLYFDQSYGFDNEDKRASYGSVGGTVYADMNIGNQYPITIGLRYNHILNQNFPIKNNWEVILPIKIF